MFAGAAIIFFAYIGFDSVSVHSEEAKNPAKDVPIGIITSLIICTILYIAVSAVLTGMVPTKEIDINAPVVEAFKRAGVVWMQYLVAFGAMTGITSVLLVPILGILTCLLLMFSLPYENWVRLIIWLIIGLVIYFAYGRRHSVMSHEAAHTRHEISTHGVSPAGQAVGDPDAPPSSPAAPVETKAD